MTPQQQKAKELVDIFHSKVSGVNLNYISKTHFDCQDSHRETAKQCALIACDEKIESLHPWRNSYSGRKQIEEIQSVKQEITKLT